MAILSLPSGIKPSSMEFGIEYNTHINTSPLSGSIQTVEIPGARWKASLTFNSLQPDDGREMAAFITSLRGSSGRFYITDYSHSSPRGTNLFSTVTVDGASQVGNTINTSGWTATQTGLLLPGDYIELEGSELKMVTAQVDSDGSGDATITFDPPIRTSPSDASTILTTGYRTVVLLDNDQINWVNQDNLLITDIVFSCIEAF